MSDILAKMGYIGTKKDIEDNNLIVVLFDRNSFKVKKIEKIYFVGFFYYLCEKYRSME